MDRLSRFRRMVTIGLELGDAKSQRKVVERKVVLGLESWVHSVVMPRERTAVVIRIGCQLGSLCVCASGLSSVPGPPLSSIGRIV